MALDDGILQLNRATDSGVAREIVLDGCNRRVLAVFRRGVVRLAHSPVDDVHAFLAQLVSLSDCGHRGGWLNAVDAIGEFQGDGCFGSWTHNSRLISSWVDDLPACTRGRASLLAAAPPIRGRE